jgi:O-antigen ligase
MACHSLAAELHRLRPDVAVRAAAAVLSACIGSQVLWLGWHRDLDPFGFYDNPHHLGLFASFALPLAGWLLFRLGGRLRALMPPVMLAAFYLLWQSGSRISWLVFFIAILLAALLFMRRRQAFILMAGLGSTAVVTAWVSGLTAIIGRVEELWINRWTEERVFLWPATYRVLQRNSWREWLFGHGIGSFRFEFKEVIPEVPEIHQFAFPHNAVLQLVFENGIVGTLLFLIAFGLLMGVLLRLSRRLTAPGDRYLAMALFALLCIVAGHCLLTKSIYSKYILFSLGLIAGTALVLADQCGLPSQN